MKVNVRPRFWGDLAAEAGYLAGNAGEETARRWAESVWQSVAELQEVPMLGRLRSDMPQPDIRSWRVRGFPRWAIYYVAREDGLVLYRVKHGAVDLPRLDFAS